MTDVPHPAQVKLFVRTSFSETLLLVALLVVFICFVNFYGKRWKWYYHSWKVPGPLAFPFIGNAHKFFGDPVQRMNGFLEIMRYHPDIVRAWLGPKLIYMVSKPEYIVRLISRPNVIDKDDFYDLFVVLFGNGILTSKGEIWKSHRKIITRSFGQKILDGFVGIFDEQASIFVKILKKYVGRKDIPLNLLATRCHVDNICATTMGVNMNVQTTNDDVGNTIHRMTEILGRKIFMIRYQFNLIWNFSADKKAYVQGTKSLRDMCNTAVRKRMQEYEKMQQNRTDEHLIEDGLRAKSKVMLDLLIKHSDLTEEELRDEVSTVVFGGTDTTANATVYTLLMLGLYPDVQQRVYEEVMEALGPEKSVEPADLLKLDYTERVIKESMRLFPVVSLVSRYVAEDVEIGDYVAPAGITIGFPIIHIHRSENYWKDPMKFDPDRFLPENVAKRHPLCYMPFSSGIRSCIGWKYAMMNLMTLTARIVRELRVFTEYTSLEEIEVELEIFTKIKKWTKNLV